MNFQSIQTVPNKYCSNETVPKNLSNAVMHGSHVISASGSFGYMLFQQFHGSYYTIWCSDYLMKEKTRLYGQVDYPLLELHFTTKNKLLYCYGNNEWMSVREAGYNLTWLPYVENCVLFEKEEHCATFDIHFTTEYLQGLVPAFPQLEDFLNHIQRREMADFFKKPLFASSDMLFLIRQIVQGWQKEYIHHRYLTDIKVLELLVYAITAQSNPDTKPIKLSGYEKEQLHETKRLIVENIHAPLTIPGLSKKVGMNDYKLKKGFKQLFSQTLHEYHEQILMEQARTLLLTTDRSIRDIGISLCFQHHSNFTEAFRRYYGYTPMFLRNEKGREE